jgi:tellurium resistance protein TerD
MALIMCPECSKEVSDRAESCPNCGYPLEQNMKLLHKYNDSQFGDQSAINNLYDEYCQKSEELNKFIRDTGISDDEATIKHKELKSNILKGKTIYFIKLFDELVYNKAVEEYDKLRIERKNRCNRYVNKDIRQQVEIDYYDIAIKKAELDYMWRDGMISVDEMTSGKIKLVSDQLHGKTQEYVDLWYDQPTEIQQKADEKFLLERRKEYSEALIEQVANDFKLFKAKEAVILEEYKLKRNHLELSDKIKLLTDESMEAMKCKTNEYRDLWTTTLNDSAKLTESLYTERLSFAKSVSVIAREKSSIAHEEATSAQNEVDKLNEMAAYQRESVTVFPTQSDTSVVCPKCNARNAYHAGRKGFGLGKAAVGGILLGPVGLLGGLIGSKKLVVQCIKCGNKWSP